MHSLYGLRCPTLNVKSEEPDFDVAIEGSTIRLAHKVTGHIFEYLWFERPPHLRNAIVRPADACTVAATHFAHVAERAALLQLNENRSAARRLARAPNTIVAEFRHDVMAITAPARVINETSPR